MLPEVKQDILAVLRQSVAAILEKNSFLLAELSNKTVHNASIFQDEDSVSVAVVIYALSKIVERGHTPLDKSVPDQLDKAYESLLANDFGAYKKLISSVTKVISGIDSKMRLYIQEVISQAQIRKGSKIYAHGISLARAAEMLGVSQWELMSYCGRTQTVDSETIRRARVRITFARRLFGL